ncbi:hypothetical protein [Streptomyces sp. CA-146814]|uniref:hypothetical protein n=1 Tax=Streptomyces sp. CA-146814 TaxID=3240053 RepID=UPI003D8E909D
MTAIASRVRALSASILNMADRWIALVGAGSALAGVAVTGAFTLLKGRQEAREKRRDRAEGRRILHREARRGAYLEVLRAAHEFDEYMDDVWKGLPVGLPNDPPRPPWREAEAAVKRLREAAVKVSIEGTAEVAASAHDLWISNYDALHDANRISGENAGNSTERLFMLADANGSTSEPIRVEARNHFIAAARAALGGDAPSFDTGQLDQ